MDESCAAANRQRRHKAELLILEVKPYFQMLICEKVARMGWHTATGHDGRPFVKPQEALLAIKYSSSLQHRQSPPTRLHVGLPVALAAISTYFYSVYGEHPHMFCNACKRAYTKSYFLQISLHEDR